MSRKEFWIRKGTNKWDYEQWDMDTNITTYEFDGDGFYDAIAERETKGGIHVVEIQPDEIVISRQELQSIFDRFGIVLSHRLTSELFKDTSRTEP